MKPVVDAADAERATYRQSSRKLKCHDRDSLFWTDMKMQGVAGRETFLTEEMEAHWQKLIYGYLNAVCVLCCWTHWIILCKKHYSSRLCNKVVYSQGLIIQVDLQLVQLSTVKVTRQQHRRTLNQNTPTLSGLSKTGKEKSMPFENTPGIEWKQKNTLCLYYAVPIVAGKMIIPPLRLTGNALISHYHHQM